MSFSVFECEMIQKGIKKDFKPERESTYITDLCLDPYSRYRYL